VPAPWVETAHIAPPKLSVAEAVADLAGRLRAAGSVAFAELVGRDAAPIEVVIHFLALLELYKRDLVEIDQAAAFSSIGVRWVGGAVEAAGLIDLTVEEPA
jgi:segregation and condensation protein A